MSGRTGGGNRRAGAANDKAWASGRVLTAEQRARKQEVDRKANRFLKKEVQDRLALLEARVHQLEQTSPSAPTLPGQNTGIGAQGIASCGSSAIEEIIPTAGGPHLNIVDKITQWNGASSAAGFGHAATAFDTAHVVAAESNSGGSTDDHYTSQAPLNRAVGAAVNDFEHEEFINPNRAHSGAPHPELTGVFTAGRPLAEGNDLTLFLNNLVNHIRSIDPTRVCFDDQYNQDVVINAVLKGWKYALSRYEQICPLWEVLQMVDYCLFKDCNVVERISVLRMLHVRYVFETKSMHTQQVEGPLPVWFQPHISEKLIAHEPVIDHLTWPKLRERLISTQTDVLTNKFWATFARNLRVTWQYEPLDVMTFSPESSLYQLSAQFESAITNMANWRMDVNFFYEFPGLANDVPADNYMPLRTMTPRFGIMDRAYAEHNRQRSMQQQQQQQRRRTFPVNAVNMQTQQPRGTEPRQQEIIYEPLRDHSAGAWGNFHPFEAT